MHGAGCSSGCHISSAFALRPERTHGGARFLFQRARKIDDRAARIARPLPVLARTLRVRREKSEVHVGKLLRPHTLDEVDFVARGLELSDRFVIVEQAYVHGGKVSLAEHFGDFFPFKRGRTHNGRAEELPAHRRGRRRCRDFRRTAHEVCEASL